MTAHVNKLFLLFVVFSITIGTGCVRPQASTAIDLPPTPVLAVKATWAVVTSPYLRLREAPKVDAFVRAPLHQNTVVEILSRSSEPETIERQTNYWYQVNYSGLRGWVFGAYLDLFDSEEKAEQSARGKR